MSRKQTVLELKQIDKNILYGKRNICILKDVSLSLEEGTVTAIVGKSGSGKSTLLSIACGIDAPSRGNVSILGKEYYQLSMREQQEFRNRNIGVLFQNYHLIPELTCEENIRVPNYFSKNTTEEKHLNEWIKTVGLEKKKGLFPNQLSGGEQQRTAILRAIINHPALLFADEPTGALDVTTGQSVIKFLVAYAHKMKMTILLATHDLDVANMCDQIIELSDGKIVV